MVVLEVDHKELGMHIRRHFETKLSLFEWGTTGIGKSTETEVQAMKLAEEHKREYVNWNKVSKKKKHQIAENPEKYFVLMDIRLSQMDPSDLRGLPGLDGKDVVEWKIPFWLHVATLPEIMGFLFFDEINLAPPSIQASAYQLILDRALGEVTIADGICVVAAGNRVEDRANVYDLPKPLQNRFDHVTLKIPKYEDWTNWALENDVDHRIVAFINAYPSKLMGKLDSKSNDMAFPTPRSWGKNCSRLINGVKNLKHVEQLAASAVGMGCAMEFSAFLKFQRQIDLEDILKHPDHAKKITELDMKYSLLALISEWYGSHYKKADLEKVLLIANEIQPEFAILLLRFAKAKHETSFKKQAPELKIWTKIWGKYGKYFEVS